MNKSTTMAILPVLGCLKASEEFLSLKNPEWSAINQEQQYFLKKFLKHMPLTDRLRDILKSKADKDYDVINKWLKDHKFDIQLHGNRINYAFAVASILDVLVEWIEDGENSEVTMPGTTSQYKAVKLEKKHGLRGYFNTKIHPHPIVEISTKSGDSVFMAIIDKVPNGPFGLSEIVDSLKPVRQDIFFPSSVVFPMIDYNDRVDMSWILGLQIGSLYIDQALQQTKFRMNLKGARAQSAVALSFRSLCISKPSNHIVINQPFILWIERPEIEVPLFVGLFGNDSWKEPKDLEP